MAERGSWKASLAAGILAGVAGTAAMDGYWRVESRLTGRQRNSDEASTTKIAGDLLRKAGVRAPSRAARRRGGQALQWAYGAAWGALAGAAAAGGVVRLDFGFGLPLGAALWAGGDEWALYRLGYAKRPRDYPMKTHMESLAAHLAYGCGLWAALAVQRRLSRTRLGERAGLPKVA